MFLMTRTAQIQIINYAIFTGFRYFHCFLVFVIILKPSKFLLFGQLTQITNIKDKPLFHYTYMFQPSDDMRLKFYALYKQAVLGPNTSQQPSFLYDPVGRFAYCFNHLYFLLSYRHHGIYVANYCGYVVWNKLWSRKFDTKFRIFHFQIKFLAIHIE